MKCTNCGLESARLRITAYGDRCTNCAGFSEAGGKKFDGSLTRQRVALEAVKHEGSILNPWKYDQSAKKFVPNDDFIKMSGTANLNQWYSEGDLKKSHPKLVKKMNERYKSNDTDISSVGDTDTALREVIKAL